MTDDWRQDANCRTADPSAFFPGRGESAGPALAVCAGCPVRQQCLDYAIANTIVYGVWGGKSEHERRRLKRQRRIDGTRFAERRCDFCRMPFTPPNAQQLYCGAECAQLAHNARVAKARRRAV